MGFCIHACGMQDNKLILYLKIHKKRMGKLSIWCGVTYPYYMGFIWTTLYFSKHCNNIWVDLSRTWGSVSMNVGCKGTKPALSLNYTSRCISRQFVHSLWNEESIDMGFIYMT
jgi:hypothetical protein